MGFSWWWCMASYKKGDPTHFFCPCCVPKVPPSSNPSHQSINKRKNLSSVCSQSLWPLPKLTETPMRRQTVPRNVLTVLRAHQVKDSRRDFTFSTRKEPPREPHSSPSAARSRRTSVNAQRILRLAAEVRDDPADANDFRIPFMPGRRPRFYLWYQSSALCSLLPKTWKRFRSHPNHLVINVTTHAQDIKMLTVLEPCALEYRARALLERSARQMSSTLIEDIRVPTACSYQWCRVGFFFNLFIFFTARICSHY